jgi:hypothetical protein
MKAFKKHKLYLAVCLTQAMALLVLTTPLRAEDPPKPAAKPAVKAPAKAATPAATKAPAAAPAAAGRGATTPAAAGRGAATPAAGGRGAAPAAAGGRGAAPAGGAAAGRGGPATASRGGPAEGGRGNAVGGHPQPNNARVEHRADGSEVSRRADGKPRDVHVAGRDGHPMDVHHGLAGGRRVEVERADHSRIVAERGGRSYYARPYAFHGHDFESRRYYVNGRGYDRYYGRYEYRPGIFVNVYAPPAYYPVAFYGYAYNPWIAPIPYTWGWAGNPWYGYYGGFFTPYPVYANASLWLTDYMISQSLAANYQAQLDAQIALNQPIPAGQAVLTPDVKQMIADEVRAQIALENAEAQANVQNADFNPASSGINRLLSDNRPHVFVVGENMDLIDSTGAECAVSQGDVLQFSPATPATADGRILVVMASKGGVECRRGVPVDVPFAQLQDLQNYMRETVDGGLASLQSHQGGLPTPPPSAMATAATASFVSAAPPPDPNAGALITQQMQDADKAEQATLSQPAASDALPPVPAPQAPTTTVSLGQTTDQVTGSLGQPKSIMDLGAKKIYVYPDFKVTFKDGKVSDVE